MDTEPHDLQGYAVRERRTMKRIFLIGGGVIGFGCLCIWFWNWSAAREWKKFKADLEAKGESFDLLLPPPPPDATNFGAIDALKDISVVVDGDDEKGAPGVRRRAFKSITMKTSPSDDPKPSLQSGMQKGLAVGLSPWAEAYRKSGLLSMPPDSGDAATDLLEAIDRTMPFIKELAANSGRTESQFTPPLSKRGWAKKLAGQSAPFFSPMQDAANALRLRAIAAAQKNNGRMATDSLLAMSKLSEALSQEPFIIPHLVSITITTMTHSALWEGLNRRVFSTGELAMIQTNLMHHDGRARLLYALRTELVLGLNSVQTFKSAKVKSDIWDHPSLLPKVVGIMPAGWFDQNMTTLGSLEWEYFIEPLKVSGLQAALTKSDVVDGVLAAMKKRPLHDVADLLVHLILPPATSVISRAGHIQSCNDLAITAVALERYFISHQKYPATLDALVPECLQSMPIDELNGQPLHYHLTSDGRFKLWSVGFDETDDGGKVSVDPDTGDIGRNLYRRDYKGDWVWQYTPVHP